MKLNELDYEKIILNYGIIKDNIKTTYNTKGVCNTRRCHDCAFNRPMCLKEEFNNIVCNNNIRDNNGYRIEKGNANEYTNFKKHMFDTFRKMYKKGMFLTEAEKLYKLLED